MLTGFSANLSIGECYRNGPFAGFCGTYGEVMFAPSSERKKVRWFRANHPTDVKKPLQLNQAAACGGRHRFCPTDDIHLGEDAFHV